MAAFHTGAATLQYRLVLQSKQTPTERQERYQSAERDARLAHRILFVIHNEIARADPMAPEIRKYAREMNIWLTRMRSTARLALGMECLSTESGNLTDHRLDGPASQEGRIGPDDQPGMKDQPGAARP